MQLFEAYYDESYYGYKNSEQLQKMIAKRYDIPVIERRVQFTVIDFYWWLPSIENKRGCFPKNYAGVSEGCSPCFRHKTQCQFVRKNICAQL